MLNIFSKFNTFYHLGNDDLKTGLSELFFDNKIRLFVAASLFINIIIWTASLLFNVNVKDTIVALHHNIYFGIDLIGNSGQIYFIPLLGIIFIITNIIFAYLVRREGIFFVYLFTASALLINFFLLLGLGSIILINFR
ncbi:MAG: hypothetical protein Q8Q23_03465 [bacterium]|nr:hypothetical protein [bacterium]